MGRRKYTRRDFANYEALLQGRRELLTQPAGSEAPTISTGNNPDGGVDGLVVEMHFDAIQSSSNEVQQIDDALQRIRDGTYGVCEGCDDYIAKPRLDAMPWARLCVECQREEEEESGLRVKGCTNLEGWGTAE